MRKIIKTKLISTISPECFQNAINRYIGLGYELKGDMYRDKSRPKAIELQQLMVLYEQPKNHVVSDMIVRNVKNVINSKIRRKINEFFK
jgi:signal recognition particle subunit SEC65